jgi:hypothetical protein
MPIFETPEALYACIGGLFERMKSLPQTRDFLATLELTVRFTYTQPEASITLVTRNRQQSIHYGACDEAPDVELAMTGDVAHRFWMGEISVMGAIVKRQVVLKGPLSNVMMLTPLVQTGVEIYPQHFQEFLSKGET